MSSVLISGKVLLSRSRAMSSIPSPPIPIPDWRGFQRHHPRSSQTGPVHAWCSRGWAEIGVDFIDLVSIGVGFRGWGFWFRAKYQTAQSKSLILRSGQLLVAAQTHLSLMFYLLIADC